MVKPTTRLLMPKSVLISAVLSGGPFRRPNDKGRRYFHRLWLFGMVISYQRSQGRSLHIWRLHASVSTGCISLPPVQTPGTGRRRRARVSLKSRASELFSSPAGSVSQSV
jgi:hypothetical protein